MSYSDGYGLTHNNLRKIMSGGKKWWSPLDLQFDYRWKHKKTLLDGTITRRLREMPDIVCERRRIRVGDDFIWRDCYALVAKGKKAA